MMSDKKEKIEYNIYEDPTKPSPFSKYPFFSKYFTDIDMEIKGIKWMVNQNLHDTELFILVRNWEREIEYSRDCIIARIDYNYNILLDKCYAVQEKCIRLYESDRAKYDQV